MNSLVRVRSRLERAPVAAVAARAGQSRPAPLGAPTKRTSI